jgi:hypothetical protein
LVLSGCKDSAIIQKEDVKSPDGYWTARMEIEQFGGPGTAALVTNVYLVRSNSSEKPIDILTFDDKTVATAQVQMRWIGDRRLEVSHSPESEVLFQVVKCCGGVTILTDYIGAARR